MVMSTAHLHQLQQQGWPADFTKSKSRDKLVVDQPATMGKGKVTKRERKFQASGGVKGRIKKGTITKKGKLRRRKASLATSCSSAAGAAAASSPPPSNSGAARQNEKDRQDPSKEDQKRKEDPDRLDDFIGDKNVAGLDIDSFFAHISDQIEKGPGDQHDGESNNDSANDNDDDEEEESEEDSMREKENEDTGTDAPPNASCEDDDDGGIHLKKPKREDIFSSSSSSSLGSDASGDDSESDDEDVAKAEARMKKQMAKIERSDPTFHQFLKENEKSLLDFGEDDSDSIEEVCDSDNDGSDNRGGHSDEDDEKPKHQGNSNLLTPKALQALLKSVFQSKSIKSLKKLMGAYKSACHLADSSEEASARIRPGESGKKYVIESSKVYDELMLQCLGHCHELFRYHLVDDGNLGGNDELASAAAAEGGGTEDENRKAGNKPLNPKMLEKAKKWSSIKPVLLSFFSSTLHVMLEAKEPDLLTLILRALSKYIPYLSPFPQVASSTLRCLLQLWSAPLESSEDYQVVRLNSFLRIRQLALTQPFPFIEECMKRTYHSYAGRAKFAASSSMASLPTLTFMGNCIVELYSLDYHSAYQHAFVYVRQLALLLRSAMQNKSTEGVYCWQYLYSLKLWVAILSASAPAEDGALMRSLVYPLAEVILGTARLSPSPRNLPLRLQCVRMLHQLAASSETFIPTSSLLLDCLDFKEWYLPPRKSQTATPRALQLDLILRLPSTNQQPCLRTHEQREPTLTEIMALIQHEVELYRFSPGFPEYTTGMESRLRKFAAEAGRNRQARWKAYARACLDTISRHSDAAVKARSKLQSAPRDVTELECLRPPSQPAMEERLRSLLEKEQKLASAALPSKSGDVDVGVSVNKRGRVGDRQGEENETVDDSTTRRKKRQKRSKKSTADAMTSPRNPEEVGGLSEAGRVDQKDEVREGIDWSDDD
jgi:nucleolar complex protein 2